jgi:catecholate siderophore receptor
VAKKRIKKKPARSKAGLGGPRSWLTVGTLAAYAVSGSNTPALAQENVTGKAKAKQSEQALAVRRYDIAAGPLKTAIDTFERTAGISFSVPDSRILDIQSPGVSGPLTVEQALSMMLKDTGIEYRWTSDGAVALALRRTQASVDVNATASTINSSLPKFQQPLQDLPQTVTVVSQLTMQQQGVTTLRDSLRNVAGISLAAGEGGSQGDNLTIRGFTARNDLFIDGMRDFGSYYRDPYNTQEVEVLQGPESVTFGRGSTGGVVNQASKLPGLDRFVETDLLFGTDATRRGTLDLNLPISGLGTGASFRLAAMGNINNVAGRDEVVNRRDGIAPSLAFGLGTDTRVNLSYFHQNADDLPDYGIPWLWNGPSPVNRNNYYGLSDGNYLRTYDDIGTFRIEHDVNPHVTIRDQARYANYSREAIITEPQLTGIPLGTPLQNMRVTRNEISVNSTETFLDNQLDAIAKFNTGALRHTFVTGVEGGRETSSPTRFRNSAPTTSLLDPDSTDTLLAAPTVTSRVFDSAVSAGTYAVDTVGVGRHLQFTGGIRFDRFDNTYRTLVSPYTTLERADQKPTWRAAAVYKPIPIATLYFDAGTSFNPSAESLALSAGTTNVAPETNKTYEFGTKWAFNKARLTANAAWFRTTKENAREVSPTNPLLYVLAGTQRVSGAQMDVTGRVTNRWYTVASYAYLDSVVVGSQYYPQAVGFPLANVPRHTFAFWNNYSIRRFNVGLGTNYVSSRTASSTAPLDATTHLLKQVPGYWVFNAMLEHPLGEHLDIQANVYNIANRYYYDELHPNHIVLGPGRSALIGFKIKF